MVKADKALTTSASKKLSFTSLKEYQTFRCIVATAGKGKSNTFPDSSSASKFSVEAQFPSDEPCLCGNMPFISVFIVKLFQTNITVTFSSHLSHVPLRLQAYSPIRLRKAHVTPFSLNRQRHGAVHDVCVTQNFYTLPYSVRS